MRRGEMEIEAADVEETREGAAADDLKRIPPWKEQITIRGIVASVLIGSIYSIIVMKLNLTTGLVPNLNVSAALLAFVFIKTWTKILEKANIVAAPFTRQENTIIQTCAVACYSIAVGGNTSILSDFHLGFELLKLGRKKNLMNGCELFEIRWIWFLSSGIE